MAGRVVFKRTEWRGNCRRVNGGEDKKRGLGSIDKGGEEGGKENRGDASVQDMMDDRRACGAVGWARL